MSDLDPDLMWWGPRPETPAIAGWSARTIVETVRVAELTKTGRHKRRNGYLQYKRQRRVALLHDRQGSFGPAPVLSTLVTSIDTIVIPWVNKLIAEFVPERSLDLGGGLNATYRESGGYVYITVLVAADDAGWETAEWSNKTMPVPAPGDQVFVRASGFGNSVVIRRFVEVGYTGVVVLPSERPAWHKEQNPTRAVAMVFGSEIRPPDGTVLLRDEASEVPDHVAAKILAP